MTEDEAKTKWCPFVRLAIREDGNHKDTWAQTNRGEDLSCENATNCIASACMAWRWGQKRNPDWNPHHLHMWGQRDDTATAYVRDDTQGGCGLAGAPQ